jgi:hypothetical protein
MRKRHSELALIFVLLALMHIFGCERGRVSDKPPIHLNPNMDNQPKYKAQSESDFFENGAAMRSNVEGTIAQGWLKENAQYYLGKDDNSEFINKAPVEVTSERLLRGQERFNIFCSPCHGRVGDGKGIMTTKEYVIPPSFHSDSIKTFSDGQIFDIVSNGVRNMPSYRHQIPTDDRWSIILYLRALQMSRTATINDIPEAIREDVK